MTHFDISGVDTYWWLPVIVAYVISTITSLGGLSGAFILLPFQVSVLGFTSAAVSSTNLLYNVISTPTGIYRFAREGRMVWPLAWGIIIGTLPGVFLGALIRVTLLPNPRIFKLFVGCVLLGLAVRLIYDLYNRRKKKESRAGTTEKVQFVVSEASFSFSVIRYRFNGVQYETASWKIITLALFVGLVGGAYGIGGAAIVVPFLVGAFHLPVHTVAGAALVGNFLTSGAGVIFYLLIDSQAAAGTVSSSPDWWLGLLFGIGGAAGTYTGARLQKRVPEKQIAYLLIAALLIIAGTYIGQFFRS